MESYTFYVFNNKTQQYHYQIRYYDTNNINKASEMFMNEPLSYRYKLIRAERYVEKKSPFYEGDFSTNETVKRVI